MFDSSRQCLVGSTSFRLILFTL